MPGYLILHGEVTDPDGYEEYKAKAQVHRRRDPPTCGAVDLS
jgi:uncharacterized protein (DUF1330 family)